MPLSDAQNEIIQHALPEAEAANLAMQHVADRLKDKAQYLQEAVLALTVENEDNEIRDNLITTMQGVLKAKERRKIIRSHISDATTGIANAVEDPELPARKLTDTFLATHKEAAEKAAPIEDMEPTLEGIWQLVKELKGEFEQAQAALLGTVELIENRPYQGDAVRTLGAFARKQGD